MSQTSIESQLPVVGLLRSREAANSLPVTSMLKQPKQRRSRDMVHAILDATIMVIESEGPDAFTTNRVADVAGISVGSLYQYFSNKEMLLSGAIERGIIDSEELLRANFQRHGVASPQQLLETTLNGLIDGLTPYRRLLMHAFSVTPLAGSTGVIPMLERRIADLFARWLEARGDEFVLTAHPSHLMIAASAAVLLFVRWMTDLYQVISEREFVDSVVLLLSAGVKEGPR